MPGEPAQSDFTIKTINGLKWRVRSAFWNNTLAAILENPDHWLRTRAHLFKGFERKSTVGAADGFVVKRYNFRKAINLVKDLFRPSRAAVGCEHAYQLELAGVSSPRPIAAAEKRWCRFLLTSYLVTEEIKNARELGDYLRTVSRPDRKVVQDVAQLIARLHEQGFSQRDMKEANLLLDASLQPYLVDLDGLAVWKTVPARRAAADLKRLARSAAKYSSVTRADQILFLKTYCRARGLRRVPRLES